MCAWHCTQSEIASFFKIHPDTLRDLIQEHYKDDFSTIYKRFQESGKCSLRRNQYIMSATNATMSIWTGKQYLGQKDTLPENMVGAEIAKPFNDIMAMLGTLQSETRKDADSINNIDTKSA